jgi:ribosome-associated heat shock protein Hsp15
MHQVNEVRIDKFLWAVRLYKTRSIAAEACQKGRIFIDDVAVKPSRVISKPIEFTIKQEGILFRYKIVKLLDNRIGAKLVSEYLENATPKEVLEKLELDKLTKNMNRQRGTGRPTKKERRDIERFMDDD